MSDPLSCENHPPSWEGHRLKTDNETALREAMVRVCDYRGDVTIYRKTGEPIIGYVFDRQEGNTPPHIKMYIANQSDPFIVPYHEIAEVEFSGEDTAFGRSWEDWVNKWQKPQKN